MTTSKARLEIVDVRDQEKFKQAVLFFLNRMGPLSERHLTYLMYQADFGMMEKHRRSITRSIYAKMPDSDA